jgi:Family of unknown function (DUF5677)
MSNRSGTGFEALTTVLSTAIAASKRLLLEFHFKQASFQKQHVLIVFYALIRKAESIEAMAIAKKPSGISIVVRSALENYIDFLNLLRYGDHYAQYFQYLADEQDRSYFQWMIDNPESDYSQSAAKHSLSTMNQPMESHLAEIRERMASTRSRLPERFLTRRGVNTSTMFRFQLAERDNEYGGVYKFLSHHTHGVIGPLLEGIVEGDELQWPPIEPEPSITYIDSMCGLLPDAGLRLAKKYRKPVAPLRAAKRERQRVLTEIMGEES